MELADFLFVGAIIVIIVLGMVCIHIFLPKEKNFDDQHAHSYRIMYRDGSYSITHKKATFGENIISFRSKYFYIQKSPFTVEAFCDEGVGKDGKIYRAAANMTVYFPEDNLQIFAPTFHMLNEEAIVETVSETACAALDTAVREYDGSEPFDTFCKKIADEKMKLFGLIVMSIKNLNVTKVRESENNSQ